MHQILLVGIRSLGTVGSHRKEMLHGSEKQTPAVSHDRKVKQIADSLKRQGWNVQADLTGFDRPDPIGVRKHIPDILATRKGTERLIEVETTESLKKDTKQHEAFRRSAGQKKKRSFKIEEA